MHHTVGHLLALFLSLIDLTPIDLSLIDLSPKMH